MACRLDEQEAVILYLSRPLPSLRHFGGCHVLCTFCTVRYQQQLGLPEEHSWAAPCQGRWYSTTWQAVRPAHHSTNSLFQIWSWQGAVLGRFSMRPSVSVETTPYYERTCIMDSEDVRTNVCYCVEITVHCTWVLCTACAPGEEDTLCWWHLTSRRE